MKRVCVFCGSSTGLNPEYVEPARHLGRALARRRLGLDYGGGSLRRLPGGMGTLEEFAGFIRPEHRRFVVAAEGTEALLDALERHRPPDVQRWIDDGTTLKRA